MGIHNNRRRRSQALLCWLVFAAGLLIQLLAPHLKISNGAFVIPPTLAVGANEIRPVEIVARQRRMQLISALLTVSGALGLAVLYRDILTGRTSRRASESVDGQSDLILREVSVPARPERTNQKEPTRRNQPETNQKPTRRNQHKMKTIIMRTQKFSRPAVTLLAALVAIITSAVVANATQTITVPNAAFIPYSLAAGANSAAITPAPNRSVLVMGCCTTAGFRGIGQVSLLHIPSEFIEWVGLESTFGAAITQGFSSVAGTHIVFIDFQHQVDIQVNSPDTIRVHNGSAALRAGNVTLVW